MRLGAVFITQYETTAAIQKCLEFLKEKNSGWAPKVAVVDKSAQEITAIGNTSLS